MGGTRLQQEQQCTLHTHTATFKSAMLVSTVAVLTSQSVEKSPHHPTLQHTGLGRCFHTHLGGQSCVMVASGSRGSPASCLATSVALDSPPTSSTSPTCTREHSTKHTVHTTLKACSYFSQRRRRHALISALNRSQINTTLHTHTHSRFPTSMAWLPVHTRPLATSLTAALLIPRPLATADRKSSYVASIMPSICKGHMRHMQDAHGSTSVAGTNTTHQYDLKLWPLKTRSAHAGPCVPLPCSEAASIAPE